MPHLFVVHSTRSGGSHDDATERAGTLGWFKSNPHGVSAHFVADAEGRLTECVPLERAAHHASEHNSISIGVEATQAQPDTPFTDAHYQAVALAFRRTQQWLRERGAAPIPAVLLPVGVANRAGVTGHDRTPNGIAQRKSDPGALFSFDRLLALLAGD